MKTLTLDLSTQNPVDKSYPIFIGQGLLEQKQANLLTDYITNKQVMVVSDTTVAPLYLDKVMSLLEDYQVQTCILPDGEQYKILSEVEKIWQQLLSSAFNRGVTLIALGGGVIGDNTGFGAACYQRGVNFIQIPTTLLSQVDSSVGGKTGVNHPLGKNMIGAFWQPQCVLIDLDTLDTLDDRQFSAGLAEVIKYGLLGNLNFLEFLEANIKAIMARDKVLLGEIIYQSCQDKANIVAQDELESGCRALLNFGHTFGHAIENSLGYGQYLHGEAVAIGMMMAADFSARLGLISVQAVQRVEKILQKANLPTKINTKIEKLDFINAMKVDKKAKDGVVPLILLAQLGEAIIEDKYDINLLEQVIEDYLN